MSVHGSSRSALDAPGEQRHQPGRPAYVAPYVRRAQPIFTWSHTRQRTFDVCARRYYWAYYGGHNGWERDASPRTRLAWALRHLTAYPLALGIAVHDQARRVALAVQDGAPAPDYHTLRASVRGALNRLYLRSRDRGAFERAPARHPITTDSYYGRAPDPAVFERLREKLGRCIANLLDQPLWDELSDAPRAAVRIVDTLATVSVDGVPVYAAPDLVFRTRRAGWVIVDWKTGEDHTAGAQLALYAVYLRDALGLPTRDGGYESRVVQLETGRTTVRRLTAADMAAAVGRVAAGVGRMRQYLRDVDQNVAAPAADFPLAEDARVCRFCQYHALCAPELEARGGAAGRVGL